MERVDRFSLLLCYSLGLADPKTNKKNLERAKELFESVDAFEAMELIDLVIRIVVDMQQIKPIVTRMLHSFSKGLTKESRPFNKDNRLIKSILANNGVINSTLDSMMTHVAQINSKKSLQEHRTPILDSLKVLKEMEKHYIMKENLLFPIVEQHIEQNKCELLMWSIHDDIRRNLKELINFLENKKTDVKEFNQLIGALFFDVRSMVFREEQVLLPAVLDKIPPSVFAELEKEQFQEKQVDPSMLSVINQERKIDLGTGLITPVQLVYLFNNLPVDITLVDEDDRVVYFNTPKERLFPRTKAVVGRTVQNCHPPESIDVVEKILLAFKQKKQSSAHFRINLKGRFVQISYYPIYDNNGTYKGTMEVSQDISELRTLEGEKRLLDWDDN